MCCGHSEHHGRGVMHGFDRCDCGGGFAPQCGQFFWSKKKQIRMIEKLLEQKREEVQDLEELLGELKQKK